jgi:hypothetical protein
MTNTTKHYQEETASSSSSIDTSADTAASEAASIDKGTVVENTESAITCLLNIIASLSLQVDTEKIKNVRLLEDNEKMVHEVRLKNNEIEKITLRMNILSNEILTRNSKQK